jgi:hypothetical protein
MENEPKWNLSAFVQYALKVIAIVKGQEKAESVRKRTLPPK